MEVVQLDAGTEENLVKDEVQVQVNEADTVTMLTPQEQEQEGDIDNSGDELLATSKEDVDDTVDGADLNPVVIAKEEAMQFDTSEEFAEIFGPKSEFDSWNEFSSYLEDFQTKTGTTFKPRSACSIDYANERRITGPIPERFVYSNVKMICFHFGTSMKRGAGQRRNYVGKGCGAFMNVSFNKGALRITQSHLIHTNHEPENCQPPQRHLRVFSFTEELDLMMAREVNRVNPFEYVNGEKQWIKAVDRLRNDDERFASITPRLVKKRIRFLVDKFLAITHGRRPSAEDEMGNILYELDRAKKDTMDSLVIKGKKKRRPGRPRKKPVSDDEDFYDDDESDAPTGPPYKKRALASSPSASAQPSVSKGDITLLLSYLKGKDEEDRRLRQKEVEDDRRMRQREIDLRREELSFQKERFEFEKAERRTHLDLLKAQLQTFEHSMMTKQTIAVAPKEGNQVTEYTIVVDGNNQVLESLPTLG